jgi:hypothetical protein
MKTMVRSDLGGEGNRLDSWKEIAAYLRREIRTVQRWNKSEGLPVHRHFHRKASSVYAFTREIDAWLESRRRVASAAAPREKYSEGADGSDNPRVLASGRIPAKSQLWLPDAASGVGSADLLHGENRIRLYFYVQLRG